MFNLITKLIIHVLPFCFIISANARDIKIGVSEELNESLLVPLKQDLEKDTNNIIIPFIKSEAVNLRDLMLGNLDAVIVHGKLDDYKNRIAGTNVDLLRNKIITNERFNFIVNPNNEIYKISLAQLRNIYLGKYTDWAEVGGKNHQIEIIYPINQADYIDNFLIKKFIESDLKINVKEVVDNEALINEVNSNNNAIAFVPYYIVNYKVKSLKTDNELREIISIIYINEPKDQVKSLISSLNRMDSENRIGK